MAGDRRHDVSVRVDTEETSEKEIGDLPTRIRLTAPVLFSCVRFDHDLLEAVDGEGVGAVVETNGSDPSAATITGRRTGRSHPRPL
jgi:hypothetical protein